MKIVGFLGAYYDKTNLILYVAKMLSLTGKKVIIIDTTMEQKAKYIVPNIDPTYSYITNFDEIDIAIGFENYIEIAQYLGKKQLDYDFILVDANDEKAFANFQLANAFKNYFVTTLGLYSIRKGIEIIESISQPMLLTKVIFSREVSNEENEYIDYLTSEYKAEWDKYRVYFPLEYGDQTAIMENERLSKIRFKNLSSQYMDGLKYIAEELLGSEEVGNLMRALKNFEKGE